MSGEPPPRPATVAAPVICSGTASGAEVKAAVCPGMSTARPLDPRDPSPGKTDIEAGAPPAGLTIGCGGPGSRHAPRPPRARGPAESREPRGRGDAEHLLVTRRVVAADPAHREARLADGW